MPLHIQPLMYLGIAVYSVVREGADKSCCWPLLKKRIITLNSRLRGSGVIAPVKTHKNPYLELAWCLADVVLVLALHGFHKKVYSHPSRLSRGNLWSFWRAVEFLTVSRERFHWSRTLLKLMGVERSVAWLAFTNGRNNCDEIIRYVELPQQDAMQFFALSSISWLRV